ncbi:MAG: hypothetical protein EI684_10205 [Candidatus Viridilinea halotolerans]|uniref:Uncharacterized protein n=1 Tax=Candidatus Viridilinea halotolerans TaxID=2491704 RepID=A0A426U0C9_9CHLR|nr:MAG: hypothetical protein EI684_10205 [Candidatus Viridilinea halotolerans]
MTQAELRLIEQGWEALVERLGVAEATRLVMLLDRRTGSALQHLRMISTTPPTSSRRALSAMQPFSQLDR